MRKTIIFGAIAALFGLAAAAQAPTTRPSRPCRTAARSPRRRIPTAAAKRPRPRRTSAPKSRERGDDAREHGKEAREREHESGAYEDRD